MAPLLDGEIVSVDSMQVYRGMDIATAKPDELARKQVHHHLIDFVDLDQPCDAASFREAAIPVIDELLKRGKTPILCGGTGFYFAALGGRLSAEPGSDPVLRAELEALTTDWLLDELRRVDPDTYESVDRRNRRRVVRAVEAFRLTGRPFSRLRSGASSAPVIPWANESSWKTFGLLRSRADLKARIEARVDEMFARGLVAETERLMARGLERNRTALQAIGYRQVIEHLRGERSLAGTRDLIKSRTRQFAKRQMTWFRRQMRVTWMEVAADESARQTAGRIARMLVGEGVAL